ncbi:hypothetical protein [Cupriavidus sp. SK-4]|uniref:hypothetical protein n=1 Tax=Cupriavidus sp. SK-4 TaxID=574750 RepID=UPI000B0F5AB5|nr:hypothetical protein [Cupriavidus sp. SK-4]
MTATAFAPCSASAQIVPTLEDLLTAQNRWRANLGLSYFNHEANGTAASGPIYIQVGQNIIPVATGVIPKTRNVDSLVAYAGLRYGYSADTELSFSGTGSHTSERTLFEGVGNRSSTNTNFSSLSLAISHRFLKERGSPGLVAYLETGAVEHTGDATTYFSSFTAGGTLYRTIDPVMLSLNAAYRLNLPRHDGASPTPGNVLLLTPQVGFAVNETVRHQVAIAAGRRRPAGLALATQHANRIGLRAGLPGQRPDHHFTERQRQYQRPRRCTGNAQHSSEAGRHARKGTFSVSVDL